MGEIKKTYHVWSLEILLESDKFQQEINDDVQTWFEKKYAYRILDPGAERVNAKGQYILHRKHLYAFYAPTKKLHKLVQGIMLIFVSENNRPLLLAKGVDLEEHWLKYWLIAKTLPEPTRTPKVFCGNHRIM